LEFFLLQRFKQSRKASNEGNPCVVNQKDLKKTEYAGFNNSQSAMHIVTQSDCNTDESLLFYKKTSENPAADSSILDRLPTSFVGGDGTVEE